MARAKTANFQPATPKLITRAAIALLKAHGNGVEPPEYLDQLIEIANQVQCVREPVDIYEHVRRKRWWHAMKAQQTKVKCQVQVLTDLVNSLHKDVHQPFPVEPRIPSLRDVIEEILAVQRDYDLTIDLKAKKMKIVTDDIKFAGINCGPFELVFRWDFVSPSEGLLPGSNIRIIALDPNGPEGTDLVHPHVNGDSPCWGDAFTPLKNALQGLRIYDVFMILNQYIHTYEPSQAYGEWIKWVNGEWEDGDCEDDDTFYCDECDCDRDNDDYRSCTECGNGMCNDCIKTCFGCDEYFCENHTEECNQEGCENLLCKKCRVVIDGDAYCSDCVATCRICNEQGTDDCFGGGHLFDICIDCLEADGLDQEGQPLVKPQETQTIEPGGSSREETAGPDPNVSRGDDDAQAIADLLTPRVAETAVLLPRRGNRSRRVRNR